MFHSPSKVPLRIDSVATIAELCTIKLDKMYGDARLLAACTNPKHACTSRATLHATTLLVKTSECLTSAQIGKQKVYNL